MRAIARIDGWTKVIELDEIAIKSGHIELGFSPPMSIMFTEKDTQQLCDVELTRATFKFTGYNKNSVPIFEYY